MSQKKTTYPYWVIKLQGYSGYYAIMGCSWSRDRKRACKHHTLESAKRALHYYQRVYRNDTFSVVRVTRRDFRK